MKKLENYFIPPRAGQSFKGKKVYTLPRQTMTLGEILRRFIKKELLPELKQGIYEDRYEMDLEKLAKADRVHRDEVVEELKTVNKKRQKKIEDFEKEQERLKQEAQQKQKDPKGEPDLPGPPPKGA